MFRMKKSLWYIVLFIFIFVGVKNVEASSIGKSMLEEKGLHIYAIPNGITGEENGNFWIYTEMIGEKNEPYIEENWTLEIMIHHLDTDESVVSQEVSKTSNGIGYLLSGVTLVPDYEYKDYEITVTVKNGEDLISQKKELVANMIVSWPNLAETTWEEEIEFKDEAEGMNRAVVFDWENMGLFSRVFQVDVEENLETAEIVNVEDGIWKVTLTDETTGEILFQITDQAGNSQDYQYHLKVEKQGLPIEMLVLIGMLLLVMVVFGIALFFRKRPQLSGELVKGKNAETSQFSTITEIKNKIIKARNELEEAKKKWNEKRAAYKVLLKQKRNELEKQPDGNEFLIELPQLEGRLNGTLADNCEYWDQRYMEIIKELSVYYADYDEWVKVSEEKTQEYEDIIRSFEDLTIEVKKETTAYQKKHEKLKNYLEEVYEKEKELELELGMDVRIEVTKGQKCYIRNSSRHDRGFILDEQYPMNWSNDNFEQLLGERTGIRIAACRDEDFILLHCSGSGLYQGDKPIKQMPIPSGKQMKFEYHFADGSISVICIETD